MAKCEDVDESCDYCKGNCEEEATVNVKSTIDEEEFNFCKYCTIDAVNSGVFTIVE
jgi:hypothetical protein